MQNYRLTYHQPIQRFEDAGFTTNRFGAHVSVAVGTLVLATSSAFIFLSLGGSEFTLDSRLGDGFHWIIRRLNLWIHEQV